jgi:hypothetical protein
LSGIDLIEAEDRDGVSKFGEFVGEVASDPPSRRIIPDQFRVFRLESEEPVEEEVVFCVGNERAPCDIIGVLVFAKPRERSSTSRRILSSPHRT